MRATDVYAIQPIYHTMPKTWKKTLKRKKNIYTQYDITTGQMGDVDKK